MSGQNINEPIRMTVFVLRYQNRLDGYTLISLGNTPSLTALTGSLSRRLGNQGIDGRGCVHLAVVHVQVNHLGKNVIACFGKDPKL